MVPPASSPDEPQSSAGTVGALSPTTINERAGSCTGKNPSAYAEAARLKNPGSIFGFIQRALAEQGREIEVFI